MGTRDGVPAADKDRDWTAGVVDSGHLLARHALHAPRVRPAISAAS